MSDNAAALHAVPATPDPKAELEQRLAHAKSERARLAAAREQRAAERELLDQIEDEEKELKNEQALAKAECEHGPIGKKIGAVYTKLGVVIVKKPNHVHFRRFQDQSESTSKEFLQLVRPCVVYPDLTTFDQWLEEQPAILAACGTEACRLAGSKIKEAAGK